MSAWSQSLGPETLRVSKSSKWFGARGTSRQVVSAATACGNMLRSIRFEHYRVGCSSTLELAYK